MRSISQISDPSRFSPWDENEDSLPVAVDVVNPEPDIDTDSNNSGKIEWGLDDPAASPAFEVTAPGNILRYNNDDDNQNGVEDRNDTAPFTKPAGQPVIDDELEEIIVKWSTAGANLTGSKLSFNASNVRVWDTPDKKHDITAAVFTIGIPSLPWPLDCPVFAFAEVEDDPIITWRYGRTFYVEGLAPGAAELEWILKNPADAKLGSDKVKFTVVNVNLTIYDGGENPKEVDEAVEETRGAFTVANMNDTDGDGVIDWNDTDGVTASDYGRDEIDLMKLVLHKPAPDAVGSVTLWVDPVPGVRLWADKTKTTPILITTDPAWVDGYVTFPVSELDKTIYVEVAPSAYLRNCTLRMSYNGIEDTVKATGIWATLTAVSTEDALYPALIQQSPWSEVLPNTRPQPLMENMKGTGLLPTEGNINWIANGIWMCFAVSPRGIEKLAADQTDNVDIHFDITRRVETRWWELDANGDIIHSSDDVVPKASEDFPKMNEGVNDEDPNNDTDESVEPNANRHMFSVDAPRLNMNLLVYGAYWKVKRFNAEEFVRVGINKPNEPEGPSENGEGSRCSAKFLWHSNHTLRNDGTGHWIRYDQLNDIGPGPLAVPVTDFNPWDDPS